MVKHDELTSLRMSIDKIDEQLVFLLDQRADLVQKVGEWKKLNSKDIFDPEREKKILHNISKMPKQYLSDFEIQTLFKKLIDFYRLNEEAHSLKSLARESKLIAKNSSFGFFGFGLIGACVALGLYEELKESTFLLYDPLLSEKEFNEWNIEKTGGLFKRVHQIEDLNNLDFVFLSAPVEVNIQNTLKIANRNKTVLDLGSYLEKSAYSYGFHPLAGKETSGYSSAQADLFYGKNICITTPITESNTESDVKHDPPPLAQAKTTIEIQLEKIKSLCHLLGSHAVITTSTDHNFKLAHTSHLLQLISLIYGKTLADSKSEFLVTPSGQELLRLNGSRFSMWESIFTRNQKNILQALDLFEKNLNKIKDTLAIRQSLQPAFEGANRIYSFLNKTIAKKQIFSDHSKQKNTNSLKETS